jgi:preprotein translocase subunit SecA
MCFPDYSDEIESRLMTLGVARKYKTKADIWLALGSISGSPEIFDAMAFNKEPWVEDPELDEFAKIALKTGTPISIKSGKKLGRNEPCHCGSGKKYKKCHLL